MGLPPWATSSSQLFVLITGANSGLGYCICERLINEFLTSPSRDATSHLVITVTTRSEKKTKDTLARLRKHVGRLAEKQKTEAVQTDSNKGVDWRDTLRRIHLLGTELDLCDIRGIYEAADRIQTKGVGDGNALQGILLPRLDVLILNAGISGYYGFNYPLATVDILTNIKQSVTWPNFLLMKRGAPAKPQRLMKASNGHSVPSGEDTQQLLNGKAEKDGQPFLAEIFLSNVFGHYCLAHRLMPLLYSSVDRPTGSKARIIWLGSLDAMNEEFSMDDIQGISRDGYKSSKRLTDYLVLTSHLPGAQHASASFFTLDSPAVVEDAVLTPRKSKRIAANGNGRANGSAVAVKETSGRPEMYIAHPGICVTDIVATALWQTLLWTLALYIARWLGSIWHPVKASKGSCAAVWTTLVEQDVLDGLEGPNGEKKGKWGTSTDFWGKDSVRRTEVDGWGWDGSVREEIVGEESLGRKYGAVAVTKELREQFEVDGAKLWTEMEQMRREWEELLGLGVNTHQ